MSRIEFVNYSTVELVKTNASDEDVAYAAWVSNFAEKAKDRDVSNLAPLLNFLYSENHTSPFEHGSFTFFVDTPVFVSREYLRHRTWSYNETSSRYKILSPRFYLPRPERPLVQKGRPGAYDFTEGTDEQYDTMIAEQTFAFETAWEAYENQLEAGIAKEVARNVLPFAIMTQFYATANPLNVLKFFILRSEKQALYEIRQVSKMEEEIFKTTMPITYEAFDKKRQLWDDLRELMKRHTLAELWDLENENKRLKMKILEYEQGEALRGIGGLAE